MSIKRLNPAEKAEAISNAWEQEAPEATFAGMTLAQFRNATKASADHRADKQATKQLLRGKREAVITADVDTRKANNRVLAAIIADPEFGDDCPLYAATGRTPASQRKSGKTNKTNGNGNGTSTDPTPHPM